MVRLCVCAHVPQPCVKKNVLRRPIDGQWVRRRALPTARPSELATTCITILLLVYNNGHNSP